ncbi:MAG: CRISPR-associated endoribonuclease Cas6 [Aquificae bacterium]|nr:CRISPR-associated endoribonuclease Cas6 [Aquificota bacterium]
MRIKVYLEVPKEVSIFYRRSFLSFIKRVLEEEDTDYTRRIFAKDKFKPFTFCVFFGDIKVNGEVISTNGKAILTVSSGSPDFFIRFYRGLKNVKEFNGKYINGSMKILKSEMIEEKQISDTRQTFRTLSPVVVVNKEKHPVLPEKLKTSDDNFIVYDDRAFTEELRFSLRCIFNGLPELKFTHKNGKKAVVKHLVGQNGSEKVIKIVAYQGTFTLEADPYVLNEIYKYGIGFRRYQGFGCLEIVKERS